MCIRDRDNTDRNRTSPFAFTGNKFEFRMPGSAVNLSDCNMILNTAMAKSLKDFADAMEGLAGEEFEAAAIAYIKETLKKHQRIIFNGNGYSEEWQQEAERRVKELQTEYAKLLEEKKKTYVEYRRSREEMRELLTAKANVDRVLKMEVEQDVEKEKDHGQR